MYRQMTYPTLNIIHLPHRIDREELYNRELAIQGITNYQIREGVVHDNTFIAIATAHKRIVREAKTMGLKKVLIGEDDLKFTCPTSFQYFLDNEPADYDLYLASIYMGTVKEDNTVDDFSGMTLYMVHERYYDLFLATNMMGHIDREQAQVDPDNPGVRKPRGKFVVCQPFPCIQWLTYSDQHKAVVDHTIWMQGKKLYNDKNTK
jgi:hypothetical protein